MESSLLDPNRRILMAHVPQGLSTLADFSSGEASITLQRTANFYRLRTIFLSLDP
jgi:hypothetical protein